MKLDDQCSPPRRVAKLIQDKIASVGSASALSAVVVFYALRTMSALGSANAQSWGQILIIGNEPTEEKSRSGYVELYDPVKNQFSSNRPVMKPYRVEATATFIESGPNRGKVLIAGGYNEAISSDYLDSTTLYDPATDSFIRGPQTRDPYPGWAAVAISRGVKAGWIFLGDELHSNFYDPGANRCVIGPTTINLQPYETGTPILFGPKAGSIFFAGGAFITFHQVTNPIDQLLRSSTELYDPATNAFRLGPSMNTARYDLTATALTIGPNAGKILLVGGYSVEADFMAPSLLTPLATTELYDPKTNTFAAPDQTANLKIPRADHTATVIPIGPNAGKILIAGGEQNNRTTLASTELYDPMTNAFEPGPPMLTSRTQHIAVVIKSGPEAGKILITAGLINDPRNFPYVRAHRYWTTPLAATELYDPMANRFIPGPPMRGAPGKAVAVQLPSR